MIFILTASNKLRYSVLQALIPSYRFTHCRVIYYLKYRTTRLHQHITTAKKRAFLRHFGSSFICHYTRNTLWIIGGKDDPSLHPILSTDVDLNVLNNLSAFLKVDLFESASMLTFCKVCLSQSPMSIVYLKSIDHLSVCLNAYFHPTSIYEKEPLRRGTPRLRLYTQNL